MNDARGGSSSSSGRPGFLAVSLVASAAYDWLGFLLLWTMPGWLFRLFAHPVPSDAFLFRLAALPLLLLPLVYLSAARMGSACPILVRLSIALRVVGALSIALLVLWHRPEGWGAYVCFAAGDLVWAALYARGVERVRS